ncbi:MAG: hypothetical protein OEL83_05695 [Desulforhopalus sp.]|nr:hypothetical protein [Desulforhopalus sp.]
MTVEIFFFELKDNFLAAISIKSWKWRKACGETTYFDVEQQGAEQYRWHSKYVLLNWETKHKQKSPQGRPFKASAKSCLLNL